MSVLSKKEHLRLPEVKRPSKYPRDGMDSSYATTLISQRNRRNSDACHVFVSGRRLGFAAVCSGLSLGG